VSHDDVFELRRPAKDRHPDVLIDEENGLRIIVLRLGAELITLARINEAEEWTGFRYRDKRSVSAVSGLANHATVMADHFFVSNRVWG
jgi:hypothetical protein